MNRKPKILISVLVGVALCVGVGYAAANVPPSADDGQSDGNNSSIPADRVEVVYFHRTQRCPTCLHAENMTRYTLETYFADELASGKVTFQTVDVEDPTNADILEKYYEPSYLTLGIDTVIDDTDHIEAITDIWYVSDETFVEILKGEIEQSLSGAG